MNSLPLYSIEQIKENDGKNGRKLWILINNYIYDVTEFSHPGGKEVLQDDHEIDRTEEFNSIHSKKAKELAEKFKIGALKVEVEEKKVVEKGEKEEVPRQKGGVLLPFIGIILSYFVFYKLDLFGIFNKNK